jgi:probable phosphoglycerate mutase
MARHAETAWTRIRYSGSVDLPLSDAGREQARALGLRIARSGLLGAPGAGIVSSPMRRAFETADAVAGLVGLPVRADERWREVDFGLLEGLTFEEAQAGWPDLAVRLGRGDVAIDWPNGEPWQHLCARTAAAWRELSNLGGPVLVVSHGMAIRSALTQALRASSGSTGPSLPHVPPGGTVAVHAVEDGWAVEADWPDEEPVR